jgi:uncharacterized protein (DUF2062 family)
MSASDPTKKEKEEEFGEKTSIYSRIRTQILRPDLSREVIAWSFAVGLGIAANPLLGTHTWIALICCFFVKRFHRPILLAASFINNPWTMIPIAGLSVFLGNWVLGRGWTADISGISWSSIGIDNFSSRHGFETMLSTLEPVLAPYLLGGFTLSLLAIPAGYFFMIWLAGKMRDKTTEK